MQKDFLIFGSPKIEQPEIDEVVACLKSGWISTGSRVSKFEQMFKKYKGTEYAIALYSCTAALHLAMKVIDIKPGDEVIVPSMTFCATANAVVHAGGRPVFVDCKRDTMNIDPNDVERKITPRTRAIIPVHFAGRMCDMDALMSLAHKNYLVVIEDCAHAIESEYHGKMAGTFGEMGCFSFYVTKNIITGEGGMVITNNSDYAKKIKMFGLHGMSMGAWKRFADEGYKHYQVVDAGYKYNMMDIQAAIGIHQLPRVDNYWNRRKEIWDKYNNAFKDLPVFTPAPVETDTRHAFHLYTLLLDIDRINISREDFLNRMTKAGIGVGVHYIALNLQPFYQREFGYSAGDCPNAEWISKRTVSIPISAKLTEDNVSDVIAAVREILC